MSKVTVEIELDDVVCEATVRMETDDEVRAETILDPGLPGLLRLISNKVTDLFLEAGENVGSV